MKHKYYDVIMAWASGKPIQWRHPARRDGSWRDWESNFSPSWNSEYRIKPESVKARMALMVDSSGYRYVIAVSGMDYTRVSTEPNFIRWLGEEQSYEI